MNWAIIGSGNGLLPIQHQATTWTNAGLLKIGLLGTNFSEISIWILAFSFKKLHIKYRLPKWQPFCPGGDEIRLYYQPLCIHGIYSWLFCWHWGNAQSYGTIIWLSQCLWSTLQNTGKFDRCLIKIKDTYVHTVCIFFIKIYAVLSCQRYLIKNRYTMFTISPMIEIQPHYNLQAC